MKTLISAALIATTSVAALPALAQQVPAGPAGAIAHFNQSIDSRNEKTTLQVNGESVTPSTRQGDLGDVYARFNASLDRRNDKVRNVTVVSGEPTHGVDIFRQIDAE